MTVQPSGHASRVVAATFGAAELAADEFAERAVEDRLPRLRATATAWGATVSGVTALLGTGVVIDADDQVRALRPAAGVLYGVLSAAALMCAAGSVYLAARAAEARPGPVPRDLDARVGYVDGLFRTAVRALRRSRASAGVAVVLLLCSMAVRWYGPLAG